MAWPGAFVDALSLTRQAPVVYVQPLNVGSGYGDGSYSLASIGGVGTDDGAILTGLETIPQSLHPRTCAVTLGGFSFRVVAVGGGDVLAFIRACPRGTILGLYVGLVDVAIGVDLGGSGLVLVGVGTIAGVAHVYNGRDFVGLEVTVVDLPRATQGRLTNSASAAPLFYSVSSTTTLSSTAAVGDGTYNVGTTTSFNRRVGTYPYGVVQVTPSSGDAYWRVWSASGGTSFTIQAPATASRMGTTDVGASSGDAVAEGWYLIGHPLDIVREVLISTDTGTSGTYDVLPAGWGIGVDDSLVDHDDIDAWKASALLTPSSGSYVWEMAGVDRVENPWSWLADWLGSAGYFMCMRQGQVTVRPLQNPNGDHLDTGVTIDDDDVVRVESGEVWDTTVDVEYYNCRVVSAAVTAEVYSTVMTTLPAGDWYAYDVSDRLWTNQTAVTTMEANRLALAVHAIPERVKLVCAGLRLAVLTLGDLVHFTSTFAPSRLRGVGGYLTDRALVVGHQVDWMRGTVTVDLAIYPVSEET